MTIESDGTGDGDLPAGAASSAPGRRVLSLVPCHAQEPAFDVTDERAEASWAATTAPWHPAILAVLDELPGVEDVDYPSSPIGGEIRLVAGEELGRLPSGYQVQAADAGTALVEGTRDRRATVRRLGESLGIEVDPDFDDLALDFLCLGTMRGWLRDLTIGMGHVDSLDVVSLSREVLAGARAWAAGDRTAASSRLRAAFELLTQARERFYPVDSYLLDVCLIETSTPPADVRMLLESRVPITLLGTARAIATLGEADAGFVASLHAAVDESRADVVGGLYSEAEVPLRPLESVIWQFAHGAEVYRRWIDERTTDTLARRRFGFAPQLPQIARRFGFRFGLHWALDEGVYPVPCESKRMWEASDGSALEALTRLPLGADRPIEGLKLPWQIAKAMKDDQVATVALAHWPVPVAGWYEDLRRSAAYSPVLMRWTTLGDYFHVTDRPFEILRPGLDQYVSPYLDQAVRRGEMEPVGGLVAHARWRHRLDAVTSLQALGDALSGSLPAPDAGLERLSLALETGRSEDLEDELRRLEQEAAGRIARTVDATASSARPGYLVFNPIGVARKVPVLLPEAAADLRPGGPLVTAQLTEAGVEGIVELPAFGYAWVPAETDPTAEPASHGQFVGVAGRVLRNELMEVTVDETTGGLRGLRAAGEPFARLGQQLAITGRTAPDGKPAVARMAAEGWDVDFGGPALVQARSQGVLSDPLDGRPLARFEQRYRLWAGRPILELEVTISACDERWLEQLGRAGVLPWHEALVSRWAWPDADAELRRCVWMTPAMSRADRPETAEAIDLTMRKSRVAILPGGLAHHQRHGSRMLDTLLIAGRESARVFRFGLALDVEPTFRAIQDHAAPAYVVPTRAGVPGPGPAGWFAHLDHAGVAVTRVETAVPIGMEQGWGLVFHLVETQGRPSRCKLRLVRDPISARQTDFVGEVLVDLPVEGDTVRLDLTPHEIARLEVVLGVLPERYEGPDPGGPDGE